ncbi:hypothetical protein [Desulfovibrio legallii]|uniref:hypothetical protein n=1 Tax=Desulfovibrio legallii TaxID=571438 RepID=UPI0011773D61|nr:hypothetical protein [Desulfovibrio legallii]
MEAPWFVKICKKLFQIKHEIIYFVLHGFYNKRDYMICHPHKAGFPPDSAAPVCRVVRDCCLFTAENFYAGGRPRRLPAAGRYGAPGPAAGPRGRALPAEAENAIVLHRN